jgi:hypothetical protein
VINAVTSSGDDAAAIARAVANWSAGPHLRLAGAPDRVLPDTQDERGGVIAGERVHDVNGPVRRSRAGLVFRVSR